MEQILYRKYQECHQGSNTVHDYAEEFYRLNVKTNLHESKTHLVSWFIHGLREPLKDELALHTIWMLSKAINLTLKVETKQMHQCQRVNTHRRQYVEYVPPKLLDYPLTTPHSKPLKSKPHMSPPALSKPPAKQTQPQPYSNPYAKPMPLWCYWCNQPSHHSNECPRRRMATLVTKECDLEEFEA